MSSYVARQPILDREQRPVAYELLFRHSLDNIFPEVSAEQATTKLIAEQFLNQPIHQLVGEHPCFINFPSSLLLDGLVDSLPPEKVVVEILEDAEPDQPLLDKVMRLKEQGYRLALDDFTLDPRWERFFPYIDIIKFDFRSTGHDRMRRFIEQHQHCDLQYLAEKVESRLEFNQALEMGFHLFQGYFFSHPEVVQRKSLNPGQLTMMALLKEVSRDELDYDQIELLLNRDLGLSYKLLRYVNNLRYRASQPVTNFRQAAIFLGKQEMRRFVSLVTTTSVAENKSSELYRMSLIRARFCELLALRRPVWSDPSEGFLCGLYSLLEAMLDQPIEKILEDIPLSANIVNALVHHKGELAFYLAFIKDYETVNWSRLQKRADRLGLTEDQVSQLYFEATRWVNQLLQR